MAGPFTTPVAESVPFQSEPDRHNGFTSKEVQSAIEEALALAISNDVFMTFAQYGGNANKGRHLEWYYGIDSEDAPLYFPKGSNVITIVASAVSTSSGILGFFDNTISSTIPLYTVDYNGNKRVYVEGTAINPLFVVDAGGEIEVRVVSGSISKPHIQVVFSSSLNGN